jgi:hypothetical protein
MRRFFLGSFVVCAGCTGGSPTGDLGGDAGAVGQATSTYVAVDLATRTVSYLLTADPTEAQWQGARILFRRVGSGSEQSLIAVHELTQAQWTAIAGDAPWLAVPAGVVPASAHAGDRPAYNLDYDTVVAALAAFTLPEGLRLSLPTAAQWQQAAGRSSGWTWGDSLDAAQAAAQAQVRETSGGTTGPVAVGSHSAANGFYDLHGNVWEWTAPGDAVRGGSWHDSIWTARIERTAGSAQRVTSGVDHALIGARLVLIP